MKPTDAELEILRTLWERGPSTVRDVHDALSAKRPVRYTTTLKLMQIMAEKGLVIRDESQRAHVYRPVQDASETKTNILQELREKLFAGSASQLVMHALSGKPCSTEELAAIRKLLDEQEGDSK